MNDEHEQRKAIARTIDTLYAFAEFYGVPGGTVVDLLGLVLEQPKPNRPRPDAAESARKRAWNRAQLLSANEETCHRLEQALKREHDRRVRAA